MYVPHIPTLSDEVRRIVAELAEVMQKSFSETKSAYAPDDGRPFANIEDEAAECEVSVEKGWLMKSIKHWTGIRNWIRHPVLRPGIEAREPIEGRIIDLIVYLAILYAMIRMKRIQPPSNETFNTGIPIPDHIGRNPGYNP